MVFNAEQRRCGDRAAFLESDCQNVTPRFPPALRAFATRFLGEAEAFFCCHRGALRIVALVLYRVPGAGRLTIGRRMPSCPTLRRRAQRALPNRRQRPPALPASSTRAVI